MTYSILGKDEAGRTVQIDQGARREGMYIIGASGTGKSTLIQSLVLQDIEQGLGVCLLDPHGDLTNRILETMTKRVEDVILLDVANDQFPFGLNLFSCPYPNDIRWVQYTVNQVMHIFDRLYDISRATPNMSYFLRNCTYTIIANPGYTMAEIPMLLTNDGIRRHLVGNVTEQRVLRFWTEYERIVKSRWDYSNTVLPILNKLDEFLQPMLLHIVGQSQSTIDLRKIMDERKLLFVKLDPRLEDMTTLIGSVIVAQVLNAAYSRGELLQNKRRQMNLYCDEFEWFAGEDFMQLVSEARKFGIGTTVSNQTLSQIEDPIKENILQAATLVVFRVSGQDGEELATEFSAAPPPSETRREAVLVPKQNVIDHLLNHGHPNPDVSKFVTEYLQKMKHYAQADTSMTVYSYIYYTAKGWTDTYKYYPEILQETIISLNTLLYKWMLTNANKVALESKRREVEEFLCDLLGYSHYYDSCEKPQTAEAYELKTLLDSVQKEQRTRASELTFDEWEILSEQIKKIQDQQEKICIELLKKDEWFTTCPSFEDAQLREQRRFLDFSIALYKVLFALEKEPILTESGRFEDKPLAPRTIADVEKEVAKFLSSPLKLPNLTAYVKTPTGETKITIARSTGGMNRAAFQQRMRDILSRNHKNGYLRPVGEVIEEITDRQTLSPLQPTEESPYMVQENQPMHDRPNLPKPMEVQTPAPPPQSPPLPPSRRRKAK